MSKTTAEVAQAQTILFERMVAFRKATELFNKYLKFQKEEVDFHNRSKMPGLCQEVLKECLADPQIKEKEDIQKAIELLNAAENTWPTNNDSFERWRTQCVNHLIKCPAFYRILKVAVA